MFDREAKIKLLFTDRYELYKEEKGKGILVIK